MNGYSFITGVEGIFKLNWPVDGKDWKIEQLTDYETSDIFSADVNQDGKNEYLTIEGFHGPYLGFLTVSSIRFLAVMLRRHLATQFGVAGLAIENTLFLVGVLENRTLN